MIFKRKIAFVMAVNSMCLNNNRTIILHWQLNVSVQGEWVASMWDGFNLSDSLGLRLRVSSLTSDSLKYVKQFFVSAFTILYSNIVLKPSVTYYL